MKHYLHVKGRKAAGSLCTMSNVGNSVLRTVRAIADVTRHPVASFAVEGIRGGVNALNDMCGKDDHVRNTLH